jgi:hypothetical protein
VHARCRVTTRQVLPCAAVEVDLYASDKRGLLSVPLETSKGRGHSCACVTVGNAAATRRKAIYFSSGICEDTTTA